MDKDKKEDENMGDEFGAFPIEWYKQSQLNPEFNIKLAKERIRQDQEFGASYYGGRL